MNMFVLLIIVLLGAIVYLLTENYHLKQKGNLRFEKCNHVDFVLRELHRMKVTLKQGLVRDVLAPDMYESLLKDAEKIANDKVKKLVRDETDEEKKAIV